MISKLTKTASWLVFVALAGPLSPARAAEDEALDILFIGNSLTYANDLPRLVEELLTATGTKVGKIESAAHPNWGLQDHWAARSTRKALASREWDFVVLQQGPSATEGRPSLLRYSKKFARRIRDLGAEPAIYMVWPAASRSFDFDGVIDSYRTAALEIDGLLFPVGVAWLRAWEVEPSLQLYNPDRFHPSGLGSLLAALVMCEGLVAGCAADPSVAEKIATGGIPADFSPVLFAAAQQANASVSPAGTNEATD